MAERKAKEITTTIESLSGELRKEKQLSSSAMVLANRASKESAAMKRAVESLGCKVHFSESGGYLVDIERNPPKSMYSSSSSRREMDGSVQHDENSDLSISISVGAEDAICSNPLSRMCETLCPLHTRETGCRWPDAGCAQFGSQFVGLKANFDAFDRLSIMDSYFDS